MVGKFIYWWNSAKANWAEIFDLDTWLTLKIILRGSARNLSTKTSTEELREAVGHFQGFILKANSNCLPKSRKSGTKVTWNGQRKLVTKAVYRSRRHQNVVWNPIISFQMAEGYHEFSLNQCKQSQTDVLNRKTWKVKNNIMYIG